MQAVFKKYKVEKRDLEEQMAKLQRDFEEDVDGHCEQQYVEPITGNKVCAWYKMPVYCSLGSCPFIE